MSKLQFRRFFSVDSPKAIKAREYGYLNAINYMAPSTMAGVGNLCPHASEGCKALCLGWFSGQAGMVKGNAMNGVRRSRVAKAKLFMRDRKAFLAELDAALVRVRREAARQGLKLCVRLNGATDIAWERVAPHVFRDNPDIQFVDYTKSLKRALQFCAANSEPEFIQGLGQWRAGKGAIVTDWCNSREEARLAFVAMRPAFPRNYHLTFSRSETNEADCKEVLAAGGNVAVVFAGPFPDEYLGAGLVSGDESDLRHLDPRRPRGVIIGLSPKGLKAKRDKSGFVVRL
jgi:hypothetical protein